MAAVALESSLLPLRERIVAAHHARAPLRLRGHGSKDFYGEALQGEVLETSGHSGIVSYEPSELVITARCGTPLSEIEAALVAQGQFLTFEAPGFGGDPTVGGMVAAGLSGPRRATAGALRDFVLGVHLLDAHGQVLQFGGQVMKNVAGFDVSRLICGSLGILGLITQVSLKVLPLPRAECTLVFDADAVTALDLCNRWGGQPLPLSATAWFDGRLYVRLSGAVAALRAARAGLGGSLLDEVEATALWASLRQQSHPLFAAASVRLWRLSLPSTAPLHGDAPSLIEWGGALRWLHSDAPGDAIRAAAVAQGGSATLWRGVREGPMFQPLSASSLALHRRLKHQFDPHGIFNPSRLMAGL